MCHPLKYTGSRTYLSRLLSCSALSLYGQSESGFNCNRQRIPMVWWPNKQQMISKCLAHLINEIRIGLKEKNLAMCQTPKNNFCQNTKLIAGFLDVHPPAQRPKLTKNWHGNMAMSQTLEILPQNSCDLMDVYFHNLVILGFDPSPTQIGCTLRPSHLTTIPASLPAKPRFEG